MSSAVTPTPAVTADELRFFQSVLERQMARLWGYSTPPKLQAEFVAGRCQQLASGDTHWWCLREDHAENRFVDEVLLIARMALDTRRLIVAADLASDDDAAATVAHDDLIALGWRPAAVRKYGRVALIAAVADLARSPMRGSPPGDGTTENLRSAAIAVATMVICGGIGLACVGIATLV
jgi:hypothetical protein